LPVNSGRINARLMRLAAMATRGAPVYLVMLLDTLGDMASARGLYAALGFKAIAPY